MHEISKPINFPRIDNAVRRQQLECDSILAACASRSQGSQLAKKELGVRKLILLLNWYSTNENSNLRELPIKQFSLREKAAKLQELIKVWSWEELISNWQLSQHTQGKITERYIFLVSFSILSLLPFSLYPLFSLRRETSVNTSENAMEQFWLRLLSKQKRWRIDPFQTCI